ncbi:hypothetical protein MHYP_G00246300 [Metynnis hypsauchen]
MEDPVLVQQLRQETFQYFHSCARRWKTLLIIIRDFKRENISEHSTLTLVARRRQILHGAITALNKGYFDWHKRTQIEFVGEMADDYGGPTREFFRLKNAKLRRHGKSFRTVWVTGLQIVVCQGYMKPKSMMFLRYFPKL